MPLLTTSVPNLSQGVSQQPDNLRYPGQGETQVNAYSSVVDGLTKRPNSDYHFSLSTLPLSDGSTPPNWTIEDAFIHFINRDANNKHVLVVPPNSQSAYIYNLQPTVLNQNEPPLYVGATSTSDRHTDPVATEAYLSASNPRESLKALTVADTTYILNKEKTVLLTNDTSTVLAKEAIIFVKQGDYKKEYTVTIDGADKTYTTGDGSSSNSDSLHASAGDGTDASSETIAAGLVSAIGTISGITVVRNGSVIKLTSTNSTFTVSVRDGLSNSGLGMAYQEVSAITNLPKSCFDGFRVKVKGDVELTQDDYYVKFNSKDSQTFGEGSWEEDIGYGVKTKIDASSMPLKLTPVLLGDGTTGQYVLERETWGDRLVGDDDTNPIPSFVSPNTATDPRKITDIFFFKNRLGFLSGQNIIFSEADTYTNFFRTTVLSLLDGDPIDVGVSHTKVSLLKNAIPYQEKLLLFSPQTQFVLRGTDLLTPSTVNISPVTEYDVTEKVRPLALGRYVYFPFERGEFQGVYEFFVDENTDTFDAAEITSHVPKYIPTAVRHLVGSATEDVIVATTTNKKHLYVYKYFWQGREKVQSSWSRFEFNNKILGAEFIDSELHLLTYDGSAVYSEKIQMEAGVVDTGKSYKILLDQRIPSSRLAPSYDSDTKLTTINNIPYDPEGAVVYTDNGLRVPITRTGLTTATIKGNFADTSITTGVGKFRGNFFFGFEYSMEYEFSSQTLKQPTERGGKSTSNFTHQTLRNGAIEYADTGHFTVEVTPLYRDTYSYVYNPTNLGADSVLNALVLDSGSFRFPIHSKHDEATIKIKSSSALPAHILAAEFESFVTSRSRRYGG